MPMKNRLEKILVECLCDTLHVMLCSDSSGTICTINSLVGRYPLFNFLKARSPDAMRLYFRQIPTWHCLIFDSRCTFAEEFFITIKHLPLWAPIIMLADSISDDYMRLHNMIAETNDYITIRNGIQDDSGIYNVRKKCIIICPIKSFIKLFPLLQLHTIRKKLMPNRMPEGMVLKALNVLFARNPLTVEDWSIMLGSTPRKFQRMFRHYTNYSPKKLIALYHAYRIAFETMGKHEDYGKSIISAYILDDRAKKKVMEYVLSRRSQLLNA